MLTLRESFLNRSVCIKMYISPLCQKYVNFGNILCVWGGGFCPVDGVPPPKKKRPDPLVTAVELVSLIQIRNDTLIAGRRSISTNILWNEVFHFRKWH